MARVLNSEILFYLDIRWIYRAKFTHDHLTEFMCAHIAAAKDEENGFVKSSLSKCQIFLSMRWMTISFRIVLNGIGTLKILKMINAQHVMKFSFVLGINQRNSKRSHCVASEGGWNQIAAIRFKSCYANCIPTNQSLNETPTYADPFHSTGINRPRCDAVLFPLLSFACFVLVGTARHRTLLINNCRKQRCVGNR